MQQGPSPSLRLLSHTHTKGGGLIHTSTCSKRCVHGTQLCEELTRRSAVRSGIAVLYLCLKIYILEREGIIYFMSTVLPLCACERLWVAYSVAAQYMTASRCACDTMKLCVHPREGTDTLIIGAGDYRPCCICRSLSAFCGCKVRHTGDFRFFWFIQHSCHIYETKPEFGRFVFRYIFGLYFKWKHKYFSNRIHSQACTSTGFCFIN